MYNSTRIAEHFKFSMCNPNFSGSQKVRCHCVNINWTEIVLSLIVIDNRGMEIVELSKEWSPITKTKVNFESIFIIIIIIQKCNDDIGIQIIFFFPL